MLRNAALRKARIQVRSTIFRRHLGSFDPDLDPDFIRAASMIRSASDAAGA